MGIPPDIEYGDNCLACFGAGETPKVVYAEFREIIWCAYVAPLNQFPALNTTWALTQTVNPCIWTYTDLLIEVAYGVNVPAGPPNISRLTIRTFLAVGWAFFSEGVLCQTAFDNDLVVGDCDPMNFSAYGGKAQVEWNG